MSSRAMQPPMPDHHHCKGLLAFEAAPLEIPQDPGRPFPLDLHNGCGLLGSEASVFQFFGSVQGIDHGFLYMLQVANSSLKLIRTSGQAAGLMVSLSVWLLYCGATKRCTCLAFKSMTQYSWMSAAL